MLKISVTNNAHLMQNSLDILEHDRLRIRSIGILLRVGLEHISFLFVLFNLRNRQFFAHVSGPFDLTAVRQHVAVDVGHTRDHALTV